MNIKKIHYKIDILIVLYFVYNLVHISFIIFNLELLLLLLTFT